MAIRITGTVDPLQPPLAVSLRWKFPGVMILRKASAPSVAGCIPTLISEPSFDTLSTDQAA